MKWLGVLSLMVGLKNGTSRQKPFFDFQKIRTHKMSNRLPLGLRAFIISSAGRMPSGAGDINKFIFNVQIELAWKYYVWNDSKHPVVHDSYLRR